MADFAASIAGVVHPGDCIALSGDLGAGKTSFARAFIRALAREPRLEVPSPTFTLVQTYETEPPVAHFDFYRITDPGEVDELGLAEALETGVALVEWPERAADALPSDTILIALAETDDPTTRALTLQAPAAFARRLEPIAPA